MNGKRIGFGWDGIRGDCESPEHRRMAVPNFFKQIIDDDRTRFFRLYRKVSRGHPIDEIALKYGRVTRNHLAALLRWITGPAWGAKPMIWSIGLIEPGFGGSKGGFNRYFGGKLQAYAFLYLSKSLRCDEPAEELVWLKR